MSLGINRSFDICQRDLAVATMQMINGSSGIFSACGPIDRADLTNRF